jgi:hypothetical protein
MKGTGCMSQSGFIIECLIKERYEHLLHEADQQRRYRLAINRCRATRRVGLWRVRGGLIAFRLRRQARRQRLSRRHYPTDWQSEIHDILARRDPH